MAKKASKIQLEMLQLCPPKIYLITFEKKLLSNIERNIFSKFNKGFCFLKRTLFFFYKNYVLHLMYEGENPLR